MSKSVTFIYTVFILLHKAKLNGQENQAEYNKNSNPAMDDRHTWRWGFTPQAEI